MKRFHVHIAVDNLAANIRFYSSAFGMPPTVVKEDYAKWMLDDPRVNFAISSRGAKPGLDHLGFQVDSDGELAAMRDRIAEAGIAALDQPGASCCYARSDKYWTTDPQGIAWETFHSLHGIPVYGEVGKAEGNPQAASCCAPQPMNVVKRAAAKPGACC